MKKINIFAASLLVLGMSSCDMDKYPYNALEESTYMTSLSDFSSARVGLYSPYRGITTGGYITLAEIQGDAFNAVAGFSNTYGNQYRWDFQSTDGNIEAIWANFYSIIARANYFIGSYEKAQASENYTADELAVMGAYAAEAYFTRAYSFLQLAGGFCKGYDAATAETDLGLPLQLTYAPTSDASKYPGRSSMKATYEQIMADIASAEALINPELILAADQDAINYISADVVKALKARAALQMKDYPTAAATAKALIEAGKYPLISNAAEFATMWSRDMGTEVMWQIFMSPDELGSATGSTYWGQYNEDQSKQIMDYVPSAKLVDLYDAADIRFAAFFTPHKLTVSTGAEGYLYVFNKFPGNPDLYASISVDNHYTNMSKPFRIAEQYLIAAEAYAQSGDLANASKYLNELKSKRIAGYEAGNFSSAAVLMNELMAERQKELVGEGFRISDLKRWGLGVKRENAPQDPNLVLYPGSDVTTALTKEANDFRMVWPIPKSEMDVNPQLSGQQNPGY